MFHVLHKAPARLLQQFLRNGLLKDNGCVPYTTQHNPALFAKHAIVILLFILLQLISQAIDTAARELHAESDSVDEFGLTLSLIHVVYDRIEKRLANFCHLVRAQPDIVTRLLQIIPPNESELVSVLRITQLMKCEMNFPSITNYNQSAKKIYFPACPLIMFEPLYTSPRVLLSGRSASKKAKGVTCLSCKC